MIFALFFLHNRFWWQRVSHNSYQIYCYQHLSLMVGPGIEQHVVTFLVQPPNSGVWDFCLAVGFSTNNPYSCLRKKQWIYKQCEYLQPKPFFSEFSQTSKQNWTLLQGQLQVIMTFQHNYSRPFRLSWRPPYICTIVDRVVRRKIYSTVWALSSTIYYNHSTTTTIANQRHNCWDKMSNGWKCVRE